MLPNRPELNRRKLFSFSTEIILKICHQYNIVDPNTVNGTNIGFSSEIHVSTMTVTTELIQQIIKS